MRKLFIALLIALMPCTIHAQEKTAKGESLILNWPDNEHWKVGDNQENEEQHIVDFIHEGETLEKWTELANMTTVKGVRNIPVDTAMQMMYKYSKQEAPDAKLTFIKKGELQGCGWIIFSIEAPHFITDPLPESQLWYIIQGKDGLYSNFVAVKKTQLPADFKKKWTDFFQTAKLVYN